MAITRPTTPSQVRLAPRAMHRDTRVGPTSCQGPRLPMTQLPPSRATRPPLAEEPSPHPAMFRKVVVLTAQPSPKGRLAGLHEPSARLVRPSAAAAAHATTTHGIEVPCPILAARPCEWTRPSCEYPLLTLASSCECTGIRVKSVQGRSCTACDTSAVPSKLYLQ